MYAKKQGGVKKKVLFFEQTPCLLKPSQKISAFQGRFFLEFGILEANAEFRMQNAELKITSVL